MGCHRNGESFIGKNHMSSQKDQFGDIFTRALGKYAFGNVYSKLCLTNIKPALKREFKI